jgi:hypothetical protein
MVMTASTRDEFHGVIICAVTTLVCDAQHENIDFCCRAAATQGAGHALIGVGSGGGRVRGPAAPHQDIILLYRC